MAINKDKNINLQLTISKESYQKLELIINELSKGQIIALNKSKTIEFLINKYAEKLTKSNEHKEGKEPKGEYQRKIKLLAQKLNLSLPKLANYLNINFSALKNYAYGQRDPNEKNKIILDKAFKENGIE